MDLQLDLRNARLTLVDGQGSITWQAALDRSELESACFREALVWRAGGVACLGAAQRVRFYNLETGVVESELALDVLRPSAFSLFGHFGEATLRDGTELLLVLTYTDVIAIDAKLETRWIARDVAVDGVTFSGTREDDFLLVSAEMDPPGGWFEVVLDASTGHEVSRSPSFLPGYVGIYGSGKGT